MARAKRGDGRHDGHDHGELGDQLRDYIADVIAEKLAEKARSVPRDSVKQRHKAEAYEALSERLGAGAFDFWTRQPPGERKTRISRDELAAAAVRICDTDGFAALSMRRLAAELGVGTMTLYHYVRNKEELLTLLMDTMMGEVVLGPGEPMPGHWRDALTLIATKSYAALKRHPWVLDIADDPPFGPNSVAHFDQTLQAVASLDVSLAEVLDIVSIVDEFVFGYALHERNNTNVEDESADYMHEYLVAMLEEGDYPALGKLVDELGIDGLWAAIRSSAFAPDRFERHLARLLDGIGAGLPVS